MLSERRSKEHKKVWWCYHRHDLYLFRLSRHGDFFRQNGWATVSSTYESKSSTKILNKGSCHTNNCFKEISNGVMSRFSKLTSATLSNLNSAINILYPEYAKDFQIANLVPEHFPKMKNVLIECELKANKRKEKEEKKSFATSLLLCGAMLNLEW